MRVYPIPSAPRPSAVCVFLRSSVARVFLRLSAVRVVLCFSAAVVLLCFSAAASAAQDLNAAAFVGRPVGRVSLLIEDQPSTDPSVLELIDTRAGEPLDMAAVRETIRHLMSLGRFDDVTVEAETMANGGVDLRYRVRPVHSVDSVEFRGNLGLSAGALRDRMTERFGATPPASRAAEVVRALIQLYQDHGYMRPRIRPNPVVQHNPDRTRLVFEIDSGPRARIGALAIDGAPLESRTRVLDRLDLAPGQPYDRAELQQRLTDYVGELRHRGYYQASASQRPRIRENGSIADLTVEIQPGPLVSVEFEGDPLPKGKREDLVPVEREGSVDEDLLEDSSRRIVDALRQQGYWKAQATHERREADGRLTIVFTVHRGAQYRVKGGVEITGTESVPMHELSPLVRLADGDLFVASALDASVAAIDRLYRSRGFAQVTVESSASEVAPGEVAPRISVVEGPQTIVGALTVEGNEAISASQLLAVVRTKTGDPYYGPAVAADRDALVLEYLNRGFESAEVTVRPEQSPDGTRADVLFQVFEGPQTIVDHILIVGNSRTDPAVIQNELLIVPGEPLGLADVVESQRRLSSLGLFRRVRITELPQTGSSRRDVLVTVEEALRTTIGYGGGLEIDRISRATGPNGEAREKMEFAPRGFFEIGRRNLGGRNRSVTLYTRIGLRPDAVPDDPSRTVSNFGFIEYRVVGTYREPQSKPLKGDLAITAAVEQGVRTSFNYARKGVNLELSRRLGADMRVTGRYSFGTTRTFDEQLAPEDQVTIDRLFPQVRLSGFSAGLLRDRRDDVVEPQAGTLMSVDGVVAARIIGSQVGFDKVFLQGFWYRRLGAHPIVFATGARLGFADGFPRQAQPTDANGNPIPGPPVIVDDVPASERFFAGGDTTIRGYALDSVGAPDTISSLGFPKGGNALIVLNAELRVPVWRSLGAAFFIDGGNVFARASDLDLGELRGGLGFGLRYKSPLGPIRVDLGFKMDRRVIAGELEPRTVLHFSIGQAF